MGNVQAEKIFTFMTYNFNTFLLFTFLVSLLTLAACWLIKKYICPSRNNPSQPSDVVQFQLTSEERRRHLVVQAREQRWKKCQILLQDVSMVRLRNTSVMCNIRYKPNTSNSRFQISHGAYCFLCVTF